MSPRGVVLLGFFGSACLPEVSAPMRPAEFLGLEASTPLVGRSPLLLYFSAPVRAMSGSSGPSVVRLDGRLVPIEALPITLSDTAALVPESAWPPGETLAVLLEEAFEDELGRVVEAPVEAPGFTTQAIVVDAEVALKMPRPTETWPTSLRYVALMVSPSELEIDRLWLRDGDHAVALEPEFHAQGRWRFRLPEVIGDCAPLCANATYQLEVEGRGLSAAMAPISTSSIADRSAPALIAAPPVRRGTSLFIDVTSDEPVVAEGLAIGDGGDHVVLRGPVVPTASARLQSEVALQPESHYQIRVGAEDLSGNRAIAASFELDTPPSPEIEITELVLSPLHDWSDSEPAGVPFDARPGTGTVSDADQWVELVNRSAHPIVVSGSGLVLRALDQSPTETWLESAPATYYGSGGGPERWWPGEALVVRLRGQMSRSALVLELVQGVSLLDRFELGPGESADHVGGQAPDLVHEAVAKDRTGRFRFCEPSPGDGAPAERCSMR